MLNQKERDLLGTVLVQTAIAYGVTKGKADITGYIDILEQLFNFTLEDYIRGIKNYLHDRRNRDFPTPIKLRDAAFPEADSRDQAVALSNRIQQAVTEFGWSDPSGAKTFIGELGWNQVKAMGGWVYICENLGTSKMPVLTFKAQTRDGINSDINISRLNGPSSGPLLSAAEEAPKRLSEVDEIIKLVSEKRKLPDDIDGSHTDQPGN